MKWVYTMRFNDNRCLVTGASGFLGRACLPFLVQKNCEIIAVYHTADLNTLDTSLAINFQRLDLFNREERIALLKKFKPTHMLHLAWHVPPSEYWKSQQNIHWLKISTDLFQEFYENGGKRFVGGGSLAEYDYWTRHDELDEIKTPLRPNTLYGQCKKSTFEIINHLQTHNEKMSVAWARIGLFFGKDEPASKLISQLIRTINRGEPLNLVEEDTLRCYSHVRYLGEALSQLLFSNNAKGPFNISSPYPIKIGEIVEYLLGLMQGSSLVNYGGYVPKIHEPKRLIPSVQRLVKAINFSPPNTLWEDLALMVNHHV